MDKHENQLALKYLTEQVLPILNDKTEFNKVIAQSFQNDPQIQPEKLYFWSRRINDDDYGKICKPTNLYDLAKTILLFQDQEGSMEKFKNRIIESVKSQTIVEHLISMFMKEPAVFKSSPSIRRLCEYRLKWLEDKINQKPVFSWHMPNASFPKYPQVESFLRSEQTSMDLVKVFSGIQEARRFVNSYNNQVENGFSIKSEAYGVGQTAYVTITKTRHYYDQQISLFKPFEQELQNIQNFLN